MIEINVINVGDGDSILIKFPNNAWWLVDCNIPSDESPQKSRNFHPVLEFLKKKTSDLSVVCMTHFHVDHYKGLSKILEEYKDSIKVYIDCGNEFAHISRIFKFCDKRLIPKGKELIKIQRLVNKNKKIAYYPAEVLVPLKNFPIDLGNDVSVEFIYPNSEALRKFRDDILNNELKLYTDKTEGSKLKFNKISIVIMIRYGQSTVLLCGDIENDGWQLIMQSRANIASHFVKVSHHGSNYSYTHELWDRLTNNCRTIAAISASGAEESPAREVICGIARKAESIYCTNLSQHCPSIRPGLLERGMERQRIRQILKETIRIQSDQGRGLCSGSMTFGIDNNGTVTLSWSEQDRICFAPFD